MSTSHARAPMAVLANAASRLAAHAHPSRSGHRATVYQITDRLHADRIARVPATDIAATVSSWLADLGANSPLAADLARAVTAGDWPTTYALSDDLSLDIAVNA
jgi:hypothetical protein